MVIHLTLHKRGGLKVALPVGVALGFLLTCALICNGDISNYERKISITSTTMKSFSEGEMPTSPQRSRKRPACDTEPVRMPWTKQPKYQGHQFTFDSNNEMRQVRIAKSQVSISPQGASSADISPGAVTLSRSGSGNCLPPNRKECQVAQPRCRHLCIISETMPQKTRCNNLTLVRSAKNN